MPAEVFLLNGPARQEPVDVLHVVPSFAPARGGIETLVEQAAVALREAGFASAVLAVSADEAIQPDRDEWGTRVYRILLRDFNESGTDVGKGPSTPSRVPLSSVASVYAAIRRVIAATQPQIIHIHHDSPLTIPAVTIAESMGIPHVTHVHSLVAATERPAFRQHLRDSTWVCAVSESVKASIAQSCHRSMPTIVLRNALSDPAPRITAWRPATHSVAMVGRFSREKGFSQGLRALALVRKEVPDLTIRLVGDGADARPLFTLASDLDLLRSIEYLGRLSHHDALRIVAGVDIVLVPSRATEAFSLVALEAALLGKPVVATDVGGLPETVIHGETGLLTQDGNPQGLAAAVLRLIRDPALRSSMGVRARERALARFSMERYTRELRRIYRGTLGQGDPAGMSFETRDVHEPLAVAQP